MVTSTIPSLDTSETEISQDSGSEYIPDSEEASDEDLNDDCSFSFVKNLERVCNDRLSEKQGDELFSKSGSSSNASLEIPVGPL